MTNGLDFYLGDIVYLRTADEPLRGMVTGILGRITGTSYAVTWGNTTETYHYAMELTREYIPEYASPESGEANA